MTGGRAIILGRAGRNFAAGMSGGVAYVLDSDGSFKDRCNPGLVDIETPSTEDVAFIKDLVSRHVKNTGSTRGSWCLDNLGSLIEDGSLVKVMPRDYKRVLQAEAKARSENREPAFAELIGSPSS